LRPTFAGGSPATSLLAAISALRTAAAREQLPVRAVCVGIPALVNPDTGLVDAGPNVHWHEFDLTGLLGSELTEPFAVENDVNLAGVGEAWQGGGVGLGSFVALSLGTGIGAAVVLDGRVVRGRHNAAGEIGYLITRPSQLDGVPRAGLEDLISGSALVTLARELATATPDQTSLDPAAITPTLLFEAAAAGDQVATAVIAELVSAVAITVAAVTALVDPARVILGGSIGRALAPYLDQLNTLVEKVTYRAPELVVSTLGPKATVVGAIASALALHRDAHAPTLPDIRSVVSPPLSAG
jgi:glucokinase